MKKHTSVFLHLLLIIGLLSWAGCEDDDTTSDTCVFDVPTLEYSDYCTPYFQDFRNIGQPQSSTIEDLPEGCAPSYDFARVFTMKAPQTGELFLHRYRDFPGDIYVEVFGTNCDSADKQLIECFNSRAIVAVHQVAVNGYTNIIIRAVAVQNTEYVPGTRQEDQINFAAFDSPPTLQWVNQGTEAAFTRDCNGRPNRLILSPGPNDNDVITRAELLGLNYRSCNCDQNLVAVEIPAGVNLDKLKPKVPKAEAEPDTTSTSFDAFIAIPNTTPSAFNLDINDDLFIANNSCLNFIEPSVPTAANSKLKVAIIDSGVDYNEHPIFNSFSASGSSTCITEGPLGYDFVNGDENPLDDIGHGTSVASAFLSNLQISSELSLSHYKFIGNGGGSLFDALCATSTAIANEYQLINCSWGFEYGGLPAALDHVLRQAENNKVLIVFSAGNDGQNVLNMRSGLQYFPAATKGFMGYQNLVVVGAYRQIQADFIQRASFSNYNVDVVDVAAIYAKECLQLGGGTNYAAGTSISAPIVCQELAEIMTNNGIDQPLEVIEAFKNERTNTNSGQLPKINSGRYLPLPTEDNNCGSTLD